MNDGGAHLACCSRSLFRSSFSLCSHRGHLSLVSELPLSDSTRRKGRLRRDLDGSLLPSTTASFSEERAEQNKQKSSTLSHPQNETKNRNPPPPSKTEATVACLTLGRFVFTPQQRKASAKAGPPMQNGKTHKDAGDRLAEVRSWKLRCFFFHSARFPLLSLSLARELGARGGSQASALNLRGGRGEGEKRSVRRERKRWRANQYL